VGKGLGTPQYPSNDGYFEFEFGWQIKRFLVLENVEFEDWKKVK
jgi:hypothetical protein